MGGCLSKDLKVEAQDIGVMGQTNSQNVQRGVTPPSHQTPSRNGGPAGGGHVRSDVIRTASSVGLRHPSCCRMGSAASLRTNRKGSRASPQGPRSGGGGTPTRGSPMVVRALYNYDSRVSSDISFRKGDRMQPVAEGNTDPDWLNVHHLATGLTGFVPRTYVATEESVESQDWFFPRISRKESETLLLMPENPRGTFLIRQSERVGGLYSLSVQDWEPHRGKHVKHYKVRVLDEGGYYISVRNSYPSLLALIDAYSQDSKGLCHVLTQPCPRRKPQMWDLSLETKNHWMEIDKSEITMKRVLGSGNFGEVWYGLWRDKTEVAVKKLKPGSMSPQAFLEEAQIMKSFRHERLLALYAVCSSEEPILIVTEYMSRGSLLDFLRSPEGQQFGFPDLLYVSSQVASGMAYLEKKRLIHRDLAARNILVGEGNEVKICDFGLARAIEDNEYCPKQGAKFPVKWTAPEAIMYNKFTIKSDVWSFGVLLMEIVTYGAVPYPGITNRDLVMQLIRGYRMPRPTDCPEAMYEIMLKAWNLEPMSRPTFEFLVQYLEDFDCSGEAPYREAPE
ncbi:tyrosine-protein kinase Src64B-like isoform X2 [Pollicipes pollicipes]|uniref:tyrosine-protein kinase Src64B-like isoform X2 n=1 Tax=Pollicipes pollicipes TaxID=41117 RepID=UPI001884C228|nr:tyrosine-protein kinase Src64B-like isoform X2 [Pollicipes pollicipes]XP_037077581.1 tyrosine-protein kinase Src64B-like isoform X2 [Pollicipes pollicipes]